MCLDLVAAQDKYIFPISIGHEAVLRSKDAVRKLCYLKKKLSAPQARHNLGDNLLR